MHVCAESNASHTADYVLQLFSCNLQLEKRNPFKLEESLSPTCATNNLKGFLLSNLYFERIPLEGGSLKVISCTSW